MRSSTPQSPWLDWFNSLRPESFGRLAVSMGESGTRSGATTLIGGAPLPITRDETILLRDTTADELPAVCAAERGEARQQIIPYSPERHRHEWDNPSVVYKSIRRADRFIGFVILVLDGDGRSVEFRRIVVTEPGRGIGTQVVRMARDLCRTELGRARVWLDVFETNTHARHVYEKAGFRPFGRSTHEGSTLILYEYEGGSTFA